MSAYPFIYYPTWAEFRAEIAKEFGVELRTIRTDEIDDVPDIIYLERQHDGKVLCYPFPILLEEEERMTLSLLRKICEYLELPVAHWGLTLG